MAQCDDQVRTPDADALPVPADVEVARSWLRHHAEKGNPCAKTTKIAVMKEAACGHKAGSVVLVTDVYENRCTIEPPLSPERIAREVARGSGLTTGNPCVGVPLAYVEIMDDAVVEPAATLDPPAVFTGEVRDGLAVALVEPPTPADVEARRDRAALEAEVARLRAMNTGLHAEALTHQDAAAAARAEADRLASDLRVCQAHYRGVIEVHDDLRRQHKDMRVELEWTRKELEKARRGVTTAAARRLRGAPHPAGPAGSFGEPGEPDGGCARLEAEVSRLNAEVDRLRAALAGIHRHVGERLEQHRENLALWDSGFLDPTEPDPEERGNVIERLRAAIYELEPIEADARKALEPEVPHAG